ncbi:TetR/AcrR family transcriptional regulator [Spirillospora sp. CA-142024]|uniref:TetR/AcrR family transcriptional regulator n=1 Tax=Spirillospora sp. CA-142024 TaxID=3240036 RepID=UPI003D8D1B75
MARLHPDDTKAPSDRRTLLVQAAGELFAEHAYDEVTTTQIAKRAGVAYGLIAHHFTNKRGLYIATIKAAAEDLHAVLATPPGGSTPAEQLRNGIARHIAYMDRHATGFLALMRGGNGSDSEVRAIIEDMRWRGAIRVLGFLGVREPVHPNLRAAMRGWVGYLDELIIDHIVHHDTHQDDLVELAVSALVASLRTARTRSPRIGIDPGLIDLLAGR